VGVAGPAVAAEGAAGALLAVVGAGGVDHPGEDPERHDEEDRGGGHG